MDDKPSRQDVERLLLGWSDRQRRILTADFMADDYYTAERGFAFTETELPHYYYSNNTDIYRAWRHQQQGEKAVSPIVGAWKRTLFYGVGGSSCSFSTVFNVQTNTLFVDLRLPTRRLRQHTNGVTLLDDLGPMELRWYARQHVFAGFTVTEQVNHHQQSSQQQHTVAQSYPHVCTRHHCIDWNYTGTIRTRPNKWWVELCDNSSSGSSTIKKHDKHDDDPYTDRWKEWAYATNYHGQHYYCEYWERLPQGGGGMDSGPVVALRRLKDGSSSRDGVVVIVGDHFSYCLGRRDESSLFQKHFNSSSLVEAVDAAVAQNDLELARRWLSIEAGHGRISTGWKIDAAINYWVQGQSLWNSQQIRVDKVSNTVFWKGEPWEIFESNLNSLAELEALLLRPIAKL
jgi:hypothetical protein